MPSRNCGNCVNAPDNGIFPFECKFAGRKVAWHEHCGSFYSEGERNAMRIMAKLKMEVRA